MSQSHAQADGSIASTNSDCKVLAAFFLRDHPELQDDVLQEVVAELLRVGEKKGAER